MKNSAIQKRREQISSLLVKGKSETEIARDLKVHRNTIVRDVSYLKEFSQNWLVGLAKNGFIFEYKLALDKIRNHERELQILFETSNDENIKIQILKLLDENTKLYLELLGESPTIHAFRKATSKEENLV
jgi:IS30 family transposase